MDFEDLCVNTLRFLAVDSVEKAKSGHPGAPMGQAAMAYVLWDKFLKHNPRDPSWPDRDRFILSSGHASALLYALLYLTGYDLTLEDIKNFRQWGSKTPGHPEYGLTPGVEATTGPLGQGLANAVGMAIAERWLASHYNKVACGATLRKNRALNSDGHTVNRRYRERSMGWHDSITQLELRGLFDIGRWQHELLIGTEYEDYRKKERVTAIAGSPMRSTSTTRSTASPNPMASAPALTSPNR